MSSGSIFSGLIMGTIIFYFIFDLDRDENLVFSIKDLLIWIFLGAMFCFFTYPVIGGAFFIPLSGLVYAFFENLITFKMLINGSIDVIFRAPMNIMTSGAPILISSLFIGSFFGPIVYSIIYLKSNRLSIFAKTIIVSILLISLPYWVPLKILANFA
ncbi:MAG: hypothetical protein CL758_05360 [Chloroflexi bacterium]|nr:hypothetical protein [Chloroflexota bacterium]